MSGITLKSVTCCCMRLLIPDRGATPLYFFFVQSHLQPPHIIILSHSPQDQFHPPVPQSDSLAAAATRDRNHGNFSLMHLDAHPDCVFSPLIIVLTPCCFFASGVHVLLGTAKGIVADPRMPCDNN